MGCEQCEGGYIAYHECPARDVPNDMRHAIFEAEMFDKGITPVTGGLYDQDNWFIEFSKQFISYRNQMQSEG